MKKALLTTTALVAFSGAAFADSVAAVSDAGKSHHVHKPTVVFHGTAMVKYNVPLVLTTNGVKNKADGTVSSDVDLDVTMTSPGTYSATVSYGLEGNAIGGATVAVTTPLVNIWVGSKDANGGADASDMFAEVDGMSGIGTDEDATDWYVQLPNFGGWTLAASGLADMNGTTNGTANTEKTSIGLSGSVGGMTITAGGMHKSGGASVSLPLMGATVTAAFASMDGTQESGVSATMPLGGMNLTVSSSTVDGGSFWGASVATTVAGYSVSAGSDSNEDSQFKITGPMGPVALHIEWDSSEATLTDADDNEIEAGVTYSVPGTKGTTISASYSNTDDDFDAGTQVKMAFSF